MGLLKIFFVIFLCSFPLGEIARFSLGNDINFTASDLSAGILCFTGVIYLIIKQQLKLNAVAKTILIFTLICFASLIANLRFLNLFQALTAGLYLIRWLMYASLYFIVANFDQQFKKMIGYGLFLAGITIVIGGYLQYLFYPNLRNLFYLGWDEHLNRIFSSFLDPNFTGCFLVLFLILNLGLFLTEKFSISQQIALAISGCLTLFAIFLTYSRGALLMLLLSVTYLLFFKKKWKILFAFLTVFSLAIIILLFNGKYENINLLRTTSALARINSDQEALTIFTKNPILGIGFDAYRFAKIRYGFFQSGLFPDHAGAGTDNSYLLLLATTGVIGFLSYLTIWLQIARVAMDKLKQNSFALILLVSILGVAVNSLFINSLFFTFIMAWMWILAGLIESR